MNNKLTLTIEREIIEIAKKYSKQKGQSLSEMVENYFKLITAEKQKMYPEELSPRVRQLRGILPKEANSNYKEIISEERLKKYDA